MTKAYFIGIVPPQQYLKRIQHFQSKWIKVSGVEPHITLKAQGGLTPDKEWIEKVERVSEKCKPFELSLDAPAYFGDNILYLSVHSNRLHDLHKEIVAAISPSDHLIEQYFEGDAFVPHLTLGKEQYGGNISTGLTKQQLKEMKQTAEEELTPYPEFEVTFIRIYERSDEEKRYVKYMDIPLRKQT